MKFISIRDLRASTSRLREELEADRELVITANGRPFAVLTRVDPDRLEEEVLAVRRSRARSALSRTRARARAKGLDRMTLEQVNEVIAKARGERRRGKELDAQRMGSNPHGERQPRDRQRRHSEQGKGQRKR